MMIFHQRIEGSCSAAIAYGQNRKLAKKVDEFFEYQRSGGDFAFDAFNVPGAAENPLAFPVVTEPASFQNGWEADFRYGLIQFASGIDDGKLGRGDAKFLKQKFFAAAVLRSFECLCRRVDRN